MPGASIYHQLAAAPPPQQMTSKPDVHPARHSSKEISPRDFLVGKELLPSKFYPAKSFNPASSTQPGAFTQQDRSFYPASAYPANSTQQVLGQQRASTLQVLPSKELIPARSLSQQVLTQQDLPSKILATTQHVLPRKELKPTCLPTKFYPAST